MTEKPNSVCKWCQQKIVPCDSPTKCSCKGYYHRNGGHYCIRNGDCTNIVAEPAEPSDCQYGRFCERHGVIHDNTGDANNNVRVEPTAEGPRWIRQESCSECDGDGCNLCKAEPELIGAAAPQPVAGEGPEWIVSAGREIFAKRLTDSLAIQHVIRKHWLAEGTPKLEEAAPDIRQKCVNFLCQYSYPAVDELAQFVESLRPFITRACAPPEQPMTEEELADLQVIDERDHWEDVISDLAVLAGCKEEWSNLHEHGDCIAEEIHRLRATPASTREPLVIPELWRLDPCKRHEDYVDSCSACEEEVLTVRLEKAYRAGFKAGALADTRSTGEANGQQLKDIRAALDDALNYLRTEQYGNVGVFIKQAMFYAAPTSVPQAEPPK